MTGHAVLRNPRALGLLGCISLQRITFAAFPVTLIVAVAGTRGFAAAALVQGARVVTGTFTAPLRARLLDRIGRHRVIVPQTVLASASLLVLAATAAQRVGLARDSDRCCDRLRTDKPRR